MFICHNCSQDFLLFTVIYHAVYKKILSAKDYKRNIARRLSTESMFKKMEEKRKLSQTNAVYQRPQGKNRFENDDKNVMNVRL